MFSPIHSCWVSFTEAERKSLMSDNSFCLEQRQTPLLPSPPSLLLAMDDILPSCYVRVSARTRGPHSLPKEWGRPYSRLKKKEEKKKLMNEALCSFIPCPYFNGTCNTANRVFAFSLSLLTFSSLSSRFRWLNSVTWLWVIVYCTCATVDVVYMYVKTKPTVI